VNRADRLARELKGTGLEDRAAELAGLPVTQVDLIVAALRSSRRAGREHEKQIRRQRKADARRHRWYDESELADRNVRMISSTGDRATRDLDALESLAGFIRHADRLERIAVDKLRAQGVSDPQIAQALGVTRDAVGRRFGRRGASTPGRTA
jgi:DNA-directed RNA polymerase specialized sigma24 family protein